MKKLFVAVLIISIYLNRSYAFFYNFLAQKNLPPPPHEMKITIGDNLNKQTLSYVALGDSLTAGVGASDYKNSFPYLLTQKLSPKNPVT